MVQANPDPKDSKTTTNQVLPQAQLEFVSRLVMLRRPTLRLSMAIAAICILCTRSLDIGTLLKQYAYCASNIHVIECAVLLLPVLAVLRQLICNMVAAIPPHSSSRP